MRVAGALFSMSDFGIYTGEQFFGLEIKPRQFIVEGILKEKDSFLIVGDEKAGKSLLTFQLICSLTSGHPFLDRFEVRRTCKVTYIQIEGELADSIDRFNRMIRVIDFDKSKFQLNFSAPMDLQSPNVRERICKEVKGFAPDVLIIDPIYFAMSGSLSDDLSVRAFIGNIRELKNELNCSVGLVHHTHRIKLDKYGKMILEGDEAIFGSKFFKAWADHTILFAYDKKRNVRIFSCATQRSGDIVDSLQLELVQPDPLFFRELDQPVTKEDQICSLLKTTGNGGMTPEEIMSSLDMKRNTFYSSLKGPLGKGKIGKENGKPVKYFFIS